MGIKYQAMVDDYAVSLDIGNGSVGWCAMYPNYHLVRAAGKNLIGVRLFEPADTAEDRRLHRTTRRRLSRRRWRLHMLDALFDEAISKQDSSFFARRKYSWVHSKDVVNQEHWYGGIIFDSVEEDRQFYKDYPTIYHLRRALIQDDRQHNIREVYLAIHHIVKYRGNFLVNGEIRADTVLRAQDVAKCVNAIIKTALVDSDDVKIEELSGFDESLINARKSKSQRVEDAMNLLDGYQSHPDVEKIVQAVLVLIVGNKANLANIFKLNELGSEEKKELDLNFSTADADDRVTQILALNTLDDEQKELLIQLQQLFNKVALKRLLGSSSYISEAMCRKYDQHHQNWETIKAELRNNSNKKDVNRYYLAYLGYRIDDEGNRVTLGKNKESKRKEAASFFRKLIEKSMLQDEDKQSLLAAIDRDDLFPIQRSADNGVIPYQLHLNELRKILDNQQRYYPFLADTFEKDGIETRKIEGLVTFRVPYFVGPLVAQEQMSARDNDENHWMVRKNNESITPWNLDEVVDKDESARRFINRLVETDTYLVGGPTLPSNSLLYQEYEVLSELNNVRKQQSAGNHWKDARRERLCHAEKVTLYNELFKRRKTVTIRSAEKCLNEKFGENVKLFGLANNVKFNSSLSSFVSLSKVFGRSYVIDQRHRDQLEQIIELQTVFEDRPTLRHQLSMVEGLDDGVVDELVGTHYTGWGRLSKKLLTSPVIDCKLGDDFSARKHSVLEIMREREVNLMEILHDKDYGFSDWIDNQNRAKGEDCSIQDMIDELRVSPKVKRGVIQAIRVVDDIAKAVGKEPSHIYLELADDIQPSRQTQSRKNQLVALYKNASLDKEFEAIKDELKDCNENDLRSDRLYLYYTQLGKDMYSGEPIDISQISSRYDIDHIIPQSVMQDDSLDNRVLVRREENARKTNSFAYTPELVSQCSRYWSYLHEQHLISDKKYKNLMRTEDFHPSEKERFVSRSLVETRQIMKNVATIMREHYGESSAVVGLSGKQTHEMRRYLGFDHKNRNINDYHHAQDALCIAAVGQFSTNRGFFVQGTVSDGAINSYNQYLIDYLRNYRRDDKKNKSGRADAFGFIVGSMRSKDDSLRCNPDTGEIVWSDDDANYLRKVMNYRKMLVTSKTGDVSDALYDETRYGHNDANGISDKGIPFDKDHSAKKLYGGFSGAINAYAALIESEGKTRLVNIPMQDIDFLRRNPGDDSLREVLSRKKPEFGRATVLLPHIHIGQLIRYGGALMTIKSANELNTAWQLWLDRLDYNELDTVLKASNESQLMSLFAQSDGEKTLSAEMLRLFDVLFNAANKYYPWHRINDDKLTMVRTKYQDLELVDKQKVLSAVLDALHADAKTANLKNIGLSGSWRRMSNMAGYQFHDDDVFIFQSPTGLFSSTVTVKELKERAVQRDIAKK